MSIMHSLIFSKRSLELFDVENFVEDIYARYNIKNSFQGNIIIALSEMMDILKNLGAQGQLKFLKANHYFEYRFSIESISENLNDVFSIDPKSFTLDTDYEKGIFAIMALCDDFMVDEDDGSISLLFKNEAETELSSHRKEFLQNYLGKVQESYQEDNA